MYLATTMYGFVVDPDHKLKNPKKLEAIFLETFMVTKPGRLTVRVMANRKRRGGCFAPMVMYWPKSRVFWQKQRQRNEKDPDT